jgi:hypothetical protein
LIEEVLFVAAGFEDQGRGAELAGVLEDVGVVGGAADEGGKIVQVGIGSDGLEEAQGSSIGGGDVEEEQVDGDTGEDLGGVGGVVGADDIVAGGAEETLEELVIGGVVEEEKDGCHSRVSKLKVRDIRFAGFRVTGGAGRGNGTFLGLRGGNRAGTARLFGRSHGFSGCGCVFRAEPPFVVVLLLVVVFVDGRSRSALNIAHRTGKMGRTLRAIGR